MVEYKIVTASEYEELEQRVNAMAKEGWKPQGGMAVLHHRWTNDHKGYDESEIIYYQAMTKEVGGST